MLSASERYYETHGEPLFSSRRSPCKSRAAPNHTRTARRRQRPTQPRVASLSKGSGRASSTHTRERSLGRSAGPEGRHQARLSADSWGLSIVLTHAPGRPLPPDASAHPVPSQAHDRPFRGAHGGERRHLRGLPHAHDQDGCAPSSASPMYLEAAALSTRGCLTTHYCVLGMHAARGGATFLLPTHFFLPTHC